MGFDDFVQSLAAQFKVIWASPLPFIVALFFVGFVIWRAMEWRYAGTIERLREDRDSLKAKLRDPARKTAPARHTVMKPVAVEFEPERVPCPPPSDRVYVGKDVTPRYLCGLFEGKTQTQGLKLTEPFIGKWIRFVTPVRNVYPATDSTHVCAGETLQRPSIWLAMCEAHLPRTETLTIGETIKAVGRIKEIREFDLKLDCCEILEQVSD